MALGMYATPQHKSHRTIFEEVRDSDLPPTEKEIERLKGEAFVLVGAGGDAAGETLTHMAYHMLIHPTIIPRLRAVLDDVQPDRSAAVPLKTLEEIPLMASLSSSSKTKAKLQY